jgi:hypothetical protein
VGAGFLVVVGFTSVAQAAKAMTMDRASSSATNFFMICSPYKLLCVLQTLEHYTTKTK